MSDKNKYLEINQKLWDKRTNIHLNSDFYDNDSFLKGRNSLNAIEMEELGKWTGLDILHLQCHFGQDSLSLARLGNKVTGIDLSGESIKTAKSLNKKLGLHCSFIQANVYDVSRIIMNKTFDAVYTSYGAVCWLPNMDAWAKVISDSLMPGGIFYMVEFHPALYMFDFPDKQLKYHYFNRQAYIETLSGSYTDGNYESSSKSVFWNHPLSEIVSSLIKHKLEVIKFSEYDFSPYNCFENMTERAVGEYVYDIDISFPHLFEIKCRKKDIYKNNI